MLWIEHTYVCILFNIYGNCFEFSFKMKPNIDHALCWIHLSTYAEKLHEKRLLNFQKK